MVRSHAFTTPSGLGLQHLQQQLVEGDAAAAVQLQEVLHGVLGRLPQQGEGHQQAAGPPPLPAGPRLLLQGLVKPVLEALDRVGTVQRVSV